MAERKEIIEALSAAFIKLPYALAMWQGGAAAFERADEWSDLDLMLITEDGHEKEAMELAVTTLEKEFGIDAQFEIDPPFWPDMVQTFFRLKNSSPFLLIDFSILPVSAKNKFNETEIHGHAPVLFDKKEIVKAAPVNRQELNTMLKGRLAKQKKRFDIFSVMVDKEINRRKDIDAFIFYWSYTLLPLVEMLRIKHSPYHWNFGSRYLNEDLPPAIATKLQSFFFVSDLATLTQRNNEARKWFKAATQEAEESFQ
jgi:hypothetical protein